jgi:hypothetical protein
MLRSCIRFGIDGNGLEVEALRGLADANLQLMSAKLIDSTPRIACGALNLSSRHVPRSRHGWR